MKKYWQIEEKELTDNVQSQISVIEDKLKTNENTRDSLEDDISKLEFIKDAYSKDKTNITDKKNNADSDKQSITNSKATRILEKNAINADITAELNDQKLITAEKTFDNTTTFIDLVHKKDKFDILNNNFTLEITVNSTQLDSDYTLLPLTFSNLSPQEIIISLYLLVVRMYPIINSILI